MKAGYRIKTKRQFSGKPRKDGFYQMTVNMVSDKDTLFHRVFEFANEHEISVNEACLRLLRKGLE